MKVVAASDARELSQENKREIMRTGEGLSINFFREGRPRRPWAKDLAAPEKNAAPRAGLVTAVGTSVSRTPPKKFPGFIRYEHIRCSSSTPRILQPHNAKHHPLPRIFGEA